MSSKKISLHSCPRCKTDALNHHFGPLNKHCTGPNTQDNEDGAVDTAESCGVPSQATAQAQPTQATVEVLHAVHSLSEQIGAIQLEQMALKNQPKRIGNSTAEASGANQTKSLPLLQELPCN